MCISIIEAYATQPKGGCCAGKHADLALVKVVNNGVVKRLFELPLRLGSMELKLGAAHLI